MKSLFEYSAGNTVIHRLNPISKIFLAFCICIAAFASYNIIFLVSLLLLNLIIGIVGRVFQKTLRLFIGLGKISIFLFILQILFVRDGTVLFLFVTDKGILLAAKLVLRLMSACIPLALMLALTQTNDLSNALVKVIHMPYKYAFTISTAIRFIPLFMDEMAGIMEAQTARGVEFDSGGLIKKMKLILPLCVPLLIISVRKIDDSAISAEVRGFYLRTRESGYKNYSFAAADMLTFAFCAALVASGILL